MKCEFLTVFPWKMIGNLHVLVGTQGGAGSPSHNALRINYIINRGLSRDLLVVSGVHGVKSTVS